MKKTNYSVLGAFLAILVAVVVLTTIFLHHSTSPITHQTHENQTVQDAKKHIVYTGKTGKTAQELLLANHKGNVAFDRSGMVVSIDDYTVSAKDHEYWAFYVNGKQSMVGAASYVTNDTDKLEWKVEKY